MAKELSPEAEAEAEEDVAEETLYANQKDALIFMIDAGKSMHSPHGMDSKLPAEIREPFQNMQPVKAALECALQVLKIKIISNPNDLFGVILYSTKHTKINGHFQHMYNLVELGEPDVEGVKSLRDLLDDDNATTILEPCESNDFSIANAFFCINQIFSDRAAGFSSKRLFVITDNETPGDSNTLQQAITRVSDLEDLDVQIEPFFIHHEGQPFNTTKFWDEVIYRERALDEEVDTVARSGICLHELLTSIKAKQAPRRSLFHLNMELGPGVQISVKGYLPIKRQKLVRSSYVYTDTDRPKLVTSETVMLCPNTEKVLKKEEIVTAYKFGGELVHMSEKEMANLKKFGDPIIRIIGFKDRKFLQPWHCMRPAYFIYPCEQPFEGSTRTYVAIYRSLLRSNKFGITWSILRQNSPPCYHAMVPSMEDDEPQGLYLIQLPFADDIRQNPQASTEPQASPALIDITRDIIKSLKRAKGYNTSSFSNPSLQWQYKILEAEALDDEIPAIEAHNDTTLPNYKVIHKRVGELSKKWKQEISKIASPEQAISGGDAEKQVQVEDNIPTDEEIQKHIAGDAMNKFKVAILKKFMHSKGFATANMKKEQLIESIKDYMAK